MKSIALSQILFLTMLSGAAFSVGAAVKADPHVTNASVFGEWEYAEKRGTYRIIVMHQGFEHVSSEVTAEWIADPRDSNEDSHLVFSKTLVPYGIYSFGEPEYAKINGRIRVTLKGINTFQAEQNITCIFDLTPARKVHVVRACG